MLNVTSHSLGESWASICHSEGSESDLRAVKLVSEPCLCLRPRDATN